MRHFDQFITKVLRISLVVLFIILVGLMIAMVCVGYV
jgi:hypothetical protein